MDFSEQVTVRGAGAKSRLDFVIDSGSSLSAVEVKTFGSPLSRSQQTVFDYINAGNQWYSHWNQRVEFGRCMVACL